MLPSMAAVQSFFLYLAILIPVSTQLTPDFYDEVCPQALPVIRNITKHAVLSEPRMGASLLRLHFHDCFVNGCDGSVLLDDTVNFTSEKTALPNLNSLRGFEVVDQIKSAVNRVCNVNVISCADILAVTARDSVNLLGGPWYKVLLGRRDSRTASKNDANNNLPSPSSNFSQLLSNFQSHGLNLTDLVVLSAAHTIGVARCTTFRRRIYNDTNINYKFAASLKYSCPITGGDNNTNPLDSTTTRFDAQYFKDLVDKKGLLHSDQELFKGDGSDSDWLVLYYGNVNPSSFSIDFAASMIKMGNMKPFTETNGEIRMNCREVNN